ncbi:MAG TPA: NADP-dependent oxidoreductase [Patescibacteria group bacterium]|nr:NADP-dependent oxidoreductase [Patescibacteria group bacterium]
MKAAQISGYGGPEVVKLTNDAPKPTPSEGQVLVEVHAASVNPFDNIVRSGMARGMKELEFPATLGGDFSGVISEVGSDAKGFKVGDEVYGQANALSSRGSFAQYAPVSTTSMALKPKNIDFITAAALPLTGVSVYQALVEHLGLQSGQKILIHGGAGGIGSLAIQLAKHIGAYVATTVTGEDLDFVKSLGADEVIDYETQDFSTILKDYDAVYDTVGGETYAKSFLVLKPGGKFVSMKQAPEGLTPPAGIEVTNQFTRVTTERLDKLTELVESGALKVYADKTFPLEQTDEAMAYLETGHTRGKVVIQVK